MPRFSFLTGVHFNVLSYGENHYRVAGSGIVARKDNEILERSVHAEHHAIERLPPPQKKLRHLKRLDILVIRVSRSGLFGNSKPCMHCISLLAEKLPEKGYSLADVYYTDASGGIQKTKLNELCDDASPHVSTFDKVTNRVAKYRAPKMKSKN